MNRTKVIFQEKKLTRGAAKMSDILTRYLCILSRRLPDDVSNKLKEISKIEVDPIQRLIYTTMAANQKLAQNLKRPSCQDTGIIQFFINVGANFPYLGEIEKVCQTAVLQATKQAPLRPNAVQTFDENNTGNNIGKDVPTMEIKINQNSSKAELFTYMAGGGCSLPGIARTLMPGEGYEEVVKFVIDQVTSYGVNACPPLLVGIGISNSIDTAARNSKLALMRPVDSINSNVLAAKMEQLLEDGINHIGIGAQGLGGKKSLLGVNIVNSARHPSVLAVALSLGCWSHRRGLIKFDANLNYNLPFNKGVEL